MNKSAGFVIKSFKLVWRIVFTALNVLMTIGFDKHSKSPYTPLQAHILYEDGLISGSAYKKALDHDY